MEVEDEVTERKAKLNKIIDQGSKLEFLYNTEEFKFFLGWVERKRTLTANAILNGKTTDQKLEWLDKGRYTALTEILEGAENYADKAKKARNALKKLEDDLKADE
jgi:hypothetical protein